MSWGGCQVGCMNCKCDSLKFITTPPTRPDRRIPFDLADTYLPRYMPRFFSYATEGPHIRIRDTAYWIIYANGKVALGVIKDEKDAQNHNLPLFILVGNWFDKESNDLFVGCKILLRSYVSIVHKGAKQPIKPYVPGERGYFTNGIPEPSAAAYEWAVAYKPVLRHTLGYIRDFTIDKADVNSARYRYRIQAFDQEFNSPVFVPDEYWTPKDIPKGPGSAVVLTYANIPEKVISYKHVKSNIDFLLPTYFKELGANAEEKICHRFLAWIDIKFYPYPADLRTW